MASKQTLDFIIRYIFNEIKSLLKELATESLQGTKTMRFLICKCSYKIHYTSIVVRGQYYHIIIVLYIRSNNKSFLAISVEIIKISNLKICVSGSNSFNALSVLSVLYHAKIGNVSSIIFSISNRNNGR